MATDTRQRMVAAAAELFRTRGYDGTGFREVVAQAGAARGAIYHHFPEGKAELGTAVVDTIGTHLAEVVDEVCASAPPAEAVAVLLDLVDRLLVRYQGTPGCPLAAVALAADDPDHRLGAATDAIFTRLQDALTGCLVRDGVPAADAASYAALAVAGAEGAVILSRARCDPEPFDQVRQALRDAVDRLPRSTDGGPH